MRLTNFIALWMLCSMLHLSIGQEIDFIEVNDSTDFSNQPTYSLVYFHFEGCGACKKMESTTLSQDSVVDFVNSNFNCYSVFGFESVQKFYHFLYDVRTFPTYLVLDKNGEPLHRFSGIYSSHEFINQLKAAESPSALYLLDSVYCEGRRDLEFLTLYLEAKSNSFEVDTSLVIEYLDKVPDSKFAEVQHFENLLVYGYYRGRVLINSKTRYYEFLKDNLSKQRFALHHESIRSRLIFSLYMDMKTVDIESNYAEFIELLNEMRELEYGSHVLLKDVYKESIYAVIPEAYPSFYLHNRKASEVGDTTLQKQIFWEHSLKMADKGDHRELNRLAWGCYTREYPIPYSEGIRIIHRALELSPHEYAYLDTKAALLYADGQYQNAKNTAKKAIKIAQKSNKEYTETERLLEKIESKIN